MFFMSLSMNAQTKGIKPVKPIENVAPGNTLAVVVGISDYQNDDIRNIYRRKETKLGCDSKTNYIGGLANNSGFITPAYLPTC